MSQGLCINKKELHLDSNQITQKLPRVGIELATPRAAADMVSTQTTKPYAQSYHIVR